jgi:ergothioneine biosynthesis protein EgtB
MLTKETTLLDQYKLTRRRTEEICDPLTPEDHVVQPVVDVSPPKWHLGHTTWFFEAFILQDHLSGYSLFNPQYHFLFNSYYESKGDRMIRTNRGNMTRPSVAEVLAYRQHVDQAMEAFLDQGIPQELEHVLAIGLQHEEQHQELLLYDIKFILGTNPLFPEYVSRSVIKKSNSEKSLGWLNVSEGTYEIGYQGDGFSFDNEHGRHRVFLHDYAIADRLVTNAEYLQFIRDGGYTDFRHWLSDGWDWVNTQEIQAPLHWHAKGESFMVYSLNGGLIPLEPHAPVCHISYYEAAAYAKWAGLRLPTESEWEVACNLYGDPSMGNFLEDNYLEAVASTSHNAQFFGDLWEWTSSAYLPYPYYEAPEGALGEYNGKFMVNQMVLRGGSCASPKNHIRPTYRNFFHAPLRWMFSGIRLAKHL